MGVDSGHVSNVPHNCVLRPPFGGYLHEYWLSTFFCFTWKILPGIALLALLLGTKTLAAIVEGLFDRSILYLISPYDSVAHVGQALIGTNVVYDHLGFGL